MDCKGRYLENQVFQGLDVRHRFGLASVLKKETHGFSLFLVASLRFHRFPRCFLSLFPCFLVTSFHLSLFLCFIGFLVLLGRFFLVLLFPRCLVTRRDAFIVSLVRLVAFLFFVSLFPRHLTSFPFSCNITSAKLTL